MAKQISIILLITISLFSSCSKEKYPIVKYKINTSSSTQILYSMVTPTLTQETVSGSWTLSFRYSRGKKVFLYALTPLLGSTTISVYINNELLSTKSTQNTGELIVIDEEIP